MKLNTGTREFQQVNPGGPDKQPKHQAPTITSIVVVVGFVALRPKSTAMVIAGRSVHLTTLFPGQA